MRAALKKVKGVVSVDCDPDARKSVVKFKTADVTIERLLEAFEDAGFPAKLIKLEDA